MAKTKPADAAPTTPATDGPAPLPPTLAERVALAVEAERNAEWERIEAKIDEVFGPGLDKERDEQGGQRVVRCDGWTFRDMVGLRPMGLQAFAWKRQGDEAVTTYGERGWYTVVSTGGLSNLSAAEWPIVRVFPTPQPPRKPSPLWNPIGYWGDVFYRWANGYK